MNLLKLNSVGSVLDMEDNVVYPQLVGGLPDLNMGVELSECSDEWVLSLSREDRMKIKWPQANNSIMNSTKLKIVNNFVNKSTKISVKLFGSFNYYYYISSVIECGC